METRANRAAGQESVAKTQAALFYSTPDRQGLVEQLKHLLQFGEGLPALTGASGAGKTVLLKQLCRELDGIDFCCYYSVEAGSALVDSLEQVCRQIGLQVNGSNNAGEMLATLRHFGQALANEQKQGVLLLDDAHHLDDSSLGAIVSLVQSHEESGYGLAFLFAGRPGLVERLDGLQLLEAPIFDFDMPLLSVSELGEFLQACGRMLPDSSESDLVKHLWVQTKGNPGVALALFDEYLKSQGNPTAREFKAWFGQFLGLPHGHFAAMVLLIGILVWAVWGGDDVQPPKSELSPALTTPRFSVSSSVPFKPTVAPLESTEIEQKANTQESAAIEYSDSSLASVAIAQQRVATSVVPASELSLMNDAERKMPSARPHVDDHRAVSAVVVDVEKPEPDGALQSLVRDHRGDEAFLLAQNEAYYTLQILAASKPESLRAYIQQQPNRDRLYLYQGLRGGKLWYVVVTGIYSSRNAALAGLGELPAAQKESGPWPRSLADIKLEITEKLSENR